MKTVKGGLFVVVEGINGGGKTTLVNNIASILHREYNFKVKTTFQPGGCVIDNPLRTILKENKLSDTERTMLNLASMSMSMKNLILPALKDGAIVLCDRFIRSTFILQHFASQYPGESKADWFSRVSQFDVIANFAVCNKYPDLEFVIDVPAELAWERTQNMPWSMDAMESEGFQYFKRQAAEYAASRTEWSQILNEGRTSTVFKVDGSNEYQMELAEQCAYTIRKHIGDVQK